MTVLLGMEIRFNHSPNDYLVYGWTEELLRETEAPYQWDEEAFHRFSQDNGMFFAQAHPYRKGLLRLSARLSGRDGGLQRQCPP